MGDTVRQRTGCTGSGPGQVEQVPPKEIIVLARLYAQLDNLEAEFLTKGIPYRVDGQEPFFKRREITALLDYIRLADGISQRQ